MPGVRFTFWQAQRLRNLSDQLWQRALATLTGSGYRAIRSELDRHRTTHAQARKSTCIGARIHKAVA
jgi:hypothetical protein